MNFRNMFSYTFSVKKKTQLSKQDAILISSDNQGFFVS